MLVTVNNFRGLTAISISTTGNDRVDLPAKKAIEEAIAKYEPEYFNYMFGATFYAYLLAYTGTDNTILSIKSYLTEAATCYIYNEYMRDYKGSYNGQTVSNSEQEGNPAQQLIVKAIEVSNRMADCNRNAIGLFTDELWNTHSVYVNEQFLNKQLC